MEGFYVYPQLKGLGIHYSREHIRRKEKDGTFPMHTKLDEAGRRIGWEKELIDNYRAERQRIADTNARAARAREGGVSHDRYMYDHCRGHDYGSRYQHI